MGTQWESLNDIKKTGAPRTQWESLNDIKKTDAPRTQWESLDDVKKTDAPRTRWESLNDIKKTDAPQTQWESLNDIKKPVDGEKVEMATRPTPESLITSAEDEVLETANEELVVMEEDVYSAEDSLEERIKKPLDEFLINSKNLSPLKAQEIEAKIVDRVDDKVKSLIAKEEGEIEVIANENLNTLDDEALQGKSN